MHTMETQATHRTERTDRDRGELVIVGGGIIGVTAAWYLVRDGWNVTVLDRAKIGAACSHGNCGLVCPSHVLPLTEPGAFKAAAKAMLSKDAAFRIKPRMDPQLWSWLWQFSKRCNERSMLTAAHGIQAMLASSMREYAWLVEQQQIECEWQENGLLFVYNSSRDLEAYEKTNRLLSESFDEPSRMLDAEQTVALEPALKDSIAGAWYYEHDAHLRPDRLVQALRQQAELRGAKFIEDTEFQSLRGTNGAVASISTSRGDYSADQFLFASGAWTPLLSEHLGCRIPIQPGKGYSMTMPRPATCPSIPIIFPEHRVAVTPMKSGYRLGSIMEFAGYDDSIRPERLALLRKGAEQYLREPYCDPVVETWYGWRPMTYDSLPAIGRSQTWGNVMVAAGHNMLGLSMAPGTARLVTEMLAGETPHMDPEPYSPARFS